jgi:biotin transport system substrate-specific component
MSATIYASRTVPAIRDMGFALAGVAVTTLLAQVQIPWEPVPFTLQTLGVAIAGLTLGARRGLLSQSLYVLGGASGLPIFAGFRGGPQHLFGPTGGYLIAFMLMALFLGWVADRGWTTSPIRLAGAMTVALGGTLLLGAGWLAFAIGWDKAFTVGVAPFLIPEALKAVAVAALVPGSRALISRASQS